MSYNVEATVDGIRFLYDGGEVEVDYNASDGDVVRLTIEPLEVKVTDGFRAAVKKACNCDSSSGGGSSGGGSGGGVLVVTPDNDRVLDKTWQEIYDAGFAVIRGTSGILLFLAQIVQQGPSFAVVFLSSTNMTESYPFVATSPNGYPVYTEVGGGGGGDVPQA